MKQLFIQTRSFWGCKTLYPDQKRKTLGQKPSPCPQNQLWDTRPETFSLPSGSAYGAISTHFMDQTLTWLGIFNNEYTSPRTSVKVWQRKKIICKLPIANSVNPQAASAKKEYGCWKMKFDSKCRRKMSLSIICNWSFIRIKWEFKVPSLPWLYLLLLPL